MRRLDAMRSKLAGITGKMKTIHNAAGDAPLTKQQQAEWDTLREESVTLAAAIEKEETLQSIEIGNQIGNHASRIPGVEYTDLGRTARAYDSRSYRSVFQADGNLDSGGFATREEFFRSLHSGLADPRLQAATMKENVGSTGGFSVPEQFVAEWLDASLESEIVRPRADVQPMTAPTKRVPGFDVSDNSGGAPFGFAAEWIAEDGSGTAQNATLRMIQLTAHKLGIFSQVSNELVADGVSFEEQLGSAMVKGTSWKLDEAFLRGTGAGQPRGVLNDAALITVAKESGQAASTIKYANVVKMFARLHPACVNNAVWVANPTTLPQLFQMTVPITNVAGTENVGGSMPPVFTESNGQFRLLGRPLLLTEKVPSLTSAGDISLIDFSQYYVGIRKEISVEKSVHVGWQNDRTGYRALVRVDGQGKWGAAFTPKNGSTLSWCVTLGAR